MVAAWGGYVFIINIIPIYVVVMVVAGRYSSRLYIAYSTFYALGSLMAMQVRSMPQLKCAVPTGFAAVGGMLSLRRLLRDRLIPAWSTRAT